MDIYENISKSKQIYEHLTKSNQLKTRKKTKEKTTMQINTKTLKIKEKLNKSKQIYENHSKTRMPAIVHYAHGIRD